MGPDQTNAVVQGGAVMLLLLTLGGCGWLIRYIVTTTIPRMFAAHEAAIKTLTDACAAREQATADRHAAELHRRDIVQDRLAIAIERLAEQRGEPREG